MANRRSNFATAELTLGTTVADDGTFTLAYPTGTSQTSFNAGLAGTDHYMIVNGNDKWSNTDPGISVSFGASEITVTNLTGGSLAAGSTIMLNFGRQSGSYRIPIVLPLPPLSAITAGDVVTAIRPGIAGTLEHAEVVVRSAVTTPAKLATLNLEIDTTNVTGGTIALTSANLATIGATVAAAAITGANTLTAASLLSVEAASVTAFLEGEANLIIYIRPTFEDAY